MIRYIISILFISISLQAYAQKYANQWYFGNLASLDFNEIPPKPTYESQMYNFEGVASIADDEGNLLFYTNGIDVWDRTNTVMPNGFGLKGNNSSTNSAVILKITDSRYFIFTITDAYNSGLGLYYNIVDMTSNNGKGDVVVKDKEIKAGEGVGERICIVNHTSEGKFWLITKHYDESKYFAYLISGESINLQPVISEVGSLSEPSPNSHRSIGYIKASHDNKHIAVADYKFGVELYDFNNSTGKLSNANFLFGGSNYRFYGAEFSYNNRYLYVGVNHKDTTYRKDVLQFDLMQPDIKSSEKKVSELNQKGGMGAFQIGPDRKIYITQSATNYLAIINKPDLPASKCDFVLKGIHMYPGGCTWGLPMFTGNFFTPPEIRYNNTCRGIPTEFKAYVIYDYDSLKWDFGDMNTGAENQSKDSTPGHLFSKNGKYKVTLKVYYLNEVKTVSADVIISGLPALFDKMDTSICEGTSITVDLTKEAGSFAWTDGYVGGVRVLNKKGIYGLVYQSPGCSISDSIEIKYLKPPNFNLGNDTILCSGDIYTIDLSANWSAAKWSDGSNDIVKKINTAGTYIAKVDYLNCSTTDTIKVNYYPPLPTLDLGFDRSVCNGKSYRVDIINTNGYELVWSNGVHGNSNEFTEDGTYYVTTAPHICGQVSDSISLKFYKENCGLYVPNAFSPNGDGINDVFEAVSLEYVVLNIKIYTRWGELLYDGLGPWNGTYKGSQLPIGSYVYVITYLEGTPGRKQFTKGTVQLIR